MFTAKAQLRSRLYHLSIGYGNALCMETRSYFPLFAAKMLPTEPCTIIKQRTHILCEVESYSLWKCGTLLRQSHISQYLIRRYGMCATLQYFLHIFVLSLLHLLPGVPVTYLHSSPPLVSSREIFFSSHPHPSPSHLFFSSVCPFVSLCHNSILAL